MPRNGIQPQQERSIDTRRRILEAAIESLVTHGYAGTTTIGVGARAGVSRGALLYHFPTRQQLVSAAVEQLFDEIRTQYQRSFTKILNQGSGSRSAAAIDLLWKTYQDDRLTAVLELWLAARTDVELRNQLTLVSDAHNEHIRDLAGSFFPESRRNERFEAVLNLVIDTLQGAAVRKLSRRESPSIRQTIALAKEIAATALSSAAEDNA